MSNFVDTYAFDESDLIPQLRTESLLGKLNLLEFKKMLVTDLVSKP